MSPYKATDKSKSRTIIDMGWYCSQNQLETNHHMQTRQENTTQGSRADSYIRNGEQPLGTEQCSHPQDKQTASIAMEDDTSLTNQQSETIELRSIDTQQTSEGSVIAFDPTNTEKQT